MILLKKFLCTVLAVISVLNCLPFTSVRAEEAVQIKISPFLYKSTAYQMEYPSHESYQVKEKSIEGDYAISRELNDLSYTFVFPAGTSEIDCKLTLDNEFWCGVSLNAKDNPSFWETDENGNVDFTKPMTFSRTEELAEQDEYGIIYRDSLKEKNVQGFKNYDKIYWKLSYVCNGKNLTHSFEIKLFDYDKAEKYVLKTVNFNVAGLPFAMITGTNVAANQKHAGRYLSSNGFDIVAVQEDFGYHSQLIENMEGFSHSTNHSGGIPGGDGLNVFTKDMPIYNETRVEWNTASGILSDGSDKLTPKGFVYSVIDIGNGIYVDYYNLHADAYGGKGSVAARTSQIKQLAEFIQARSAENDRPVIVTGDFNNYMHVHEDEGALYNTLYVECGLKDAWIERHNNGDYFNFYDWHITDLPAWGNWDSVERFMYKSGGGVDVTVSDFRYVEVYDGNGKPISDHAAAECDFTFIKTPEFVENTQKLQVSNETQNTFLHIIKWIFKDLILIFSDIKSLPYLITEFAENLIQKVASGK